MDEREANTRHTVPRHHNDTMRHIYKVASLNINGIAHPTRIRMLEEFLWQQDIDIALLQEVTNRAIENIRSYTKHINIGTDQRGTAILVKDGIQIRPIKRRPTGRGIAGVLEGIYLINIYAPSGAEKKSERETFFNKDILPLLPNTRTEILLAGDFNCVMTQAGTTGHTTHSKALDILIKGLNLKDTWNMTTTRHGYTHYTPKGAARLAYICELSPHESKTRN